MFWVSEKKKKGWCLCERPLDKNVMLTTRNDFVCYFMELNVHNNTNQNKTVPNTQPKKI